MVRLRARSAPARLKPRGLLRTKDQPVDPSVMDDVRGHPVNVPASANRLARGPIEREDPLFAGPVLDVADVDSSGLVAESRLDTARRGVLVVNGQNGH